MPDHFTDNKAHLIIHPFKIMNILGEDRRCQTPPRPQGSQGRKTHTWLQPSTMCMSRGERFGMPRAGQQEEGEKYSVSNPRRLHGASETSTGQQQAEMHCKRSKECIPWYESLGGEGCACGSVWLENWGRTAVNEAGTSLQSVPHLIHPRT